MLELLVIVAALGQVPAQNVRPQIGYVYPPGGRAGTTVDVQLGTYDWTPDMQIFVHDPRVTLEITGPAGDPIMTPPPYWFDQKAGQPQPPLAREVPARITIPADTPPGPVRWQAANANGATNVGTFVVSDTAEFVEPEKHDGALDLPPLPVTACGRISRIAEIDAYRFTVPTAGLVVCRLEDRLGQPFHGFLTVRDSAGRLVTDVADTVGQGAVATFEAQPSQTYEASLHDVEFAGDRGYVYRLSIRRGPHVLASLPLVVGRGETRAVEVIGWGVASGGLKLESATHQLTIPQDAVGESFDYPLDTPAGRATVRLSLAAGNATGDSLEPVASDLAARQLSVPSALSGTFDRVEPATGILTDRYQIAAKKGDSLLVTVEAARFDSPADPSLAIVSADGKEIVRSDDLTSSTDASVVFKVPADGTYDVIASDLAGVAPSPARVYRLTVENATEFADFTLTIPDRLDVPLGGKTDLLVKATRRGLWKGPIALRFEGLDDAVLPAGELVIPADKNDLKISLAGSDQAAAGAKLATLVGTATINPAPSEPAKKAPKTPAKNAPAAEPSATDAVAIEPRTVERRAGPCLIAATLKTRCVVKSATQDGGRIVNRGTTYPADVNIERLESYQGPVTLMMAAVQQRQRRGIYGGEITAPAGVDQAQYPIALPEWLETSLTCRMILVGVVQVPDPKGNLRYVTGNMDGFIVMSIEGGLFKISTETLERVVHVGGTIDIAVRVARGTKLPEPVRLEIVPGDDLAGFVSADPIVVPVDRSEAVVKLRLADEPRLAGARKLTIRATALQNGRWPAVSETAVPLVIERR